MKTLSSEHREGNKIPTVAVIGGGPAGLFSVFTLGMLGFRAVLFDRLSVLGGQCNLYPDKPIYDIPGYPHIFAKELIDKLAEQINPFQPTFCLNQMVHGVERKGKKFQIKTDSNVCHTADAIIIAAGIGAFSHKKPPLPGVDQFENNQIFYSVTDKMKFKDKHVMIAGGGDSAADWIIELSQIAKRVTVVHRRDNFRCHPSSGRQIMELHEQGKIDLHIPYQLHDLMCTQKKMQGVRLRHMQTQNIKDIHCDFLLPFFGLSADLKPLKNLECEFHKNAVPVNSENMMTSQDGIFAIGDIAYYPGKLKLIMNGFGEAATCAYGIRKYVYPHQDFHFEYSTNSGVKSIFK